MGLGLGLACPEVPVTVPEAGDELLEELEDDEDEEDDPELPEEPEPEEPEPEEPAHQKATSLPHDKSPKQQA